MWNSPYTLASKSVKVENGYVTGTLIKYLGENVTTVQLPVLITFLESGAARVTIDELKRRQGEIELRHGSQARKERYHEASFWAISGEEKPDKLAKGETSLQETVVNYGPLNRYRVVISHYPFAINFFRDDELQIEFNGKGLMNIEHWRPKDEGEAKSDGEKDKKHEDESTWWDETFGGNTDLKPKGPESVAMDITFHGYDHVYGIPGHASSLSLKETRGGAGNYDQPYRLYNLDVFEYEMDSPMTLYGAIPFMQAHRKDSTVGVFWLNAAETWVDIVKRKYSSNPLNLGTSGSTSDVDTHWFSESGLLDVYVFLGPTPKDVIEDYSALTGNTQLPQLFALGYHQSRWNYMSDEDVKDVDKKMDKADIPYDVIWLDIEYTDDRKYFTWNSHTFPDPLGMQKQLDDHERKLVVIIDPHIKNCRNYPVVDELKSKDLGVKNKEGKLYEGWCWPGSSHWVDCFNPAAREWWRSLFTYKSFKGIASNAFLWNDMNEPSVFNGPETTMPKDNLHFGNWEHRDVHNINGMTFVNATFDAALNRDPPNLRRRPFVLTRAYYSGSQRLGAMWTGDNQASWTHLAASIPMILTHNIAGFPFSGADVGGFFGNPSNELLLRWYQAGCFYPFFRGHAHIDTQRREPYLVGEPYQGIITQALRLRYSLLPAWYTSFHRASVSNTPILQPNFYVHPSDEAGFALEDQFYVSGTGLLVKPVVTESATTVSIYLPPDELYYDYFTYNTHAGKGATVMLNAPLESIPILIRAGHVIPRKDRPRRSSGLMRWDPYTLLITLSANGTAEGDLYVDDGESYDYLSGAFVHRRFIFSGGRLESVDIASGPSSKGKKRKEFLKMMDVVRIEKIIVVGAPKAWAGREMVTVLDEGNVGTARLEFTKGSGKKANFVVVRDPGVGVARGWTVDFEGRKEHSELR